jgi:ribosomal protein S18 acetylase RimI-like enzyme
MAVPTDLPAPLDDPVARACRLNYVEFCRELSRWSGPGGAVAERDGLMLWGTTSDFPVSLNGVVRLDPATPANHVIAVADEWFSARGTGYTLNAVDGADDDLRAAADAAGLLVLRDSPQMVCDGPAAVPDPGPGVELVWVDRPAQVVAFADLVDTAYQSLGAPAGAIRPSIVALDRLLEPQVETVLALLDGEPVACAQLLLSHGMGGVYYVGTLEAARGRGLGEIVTAAVTNRGFERGAACLGLQASPMGEAIYRRMGYRDLYRQAGLVRVEPPAT